MQDCPCWVDFAQLQLPARIPHPLPCKAPGKAPGGGSCTYRDLERGGPAVVQHGAALGVLQLVVDGERHRLHVVSRVLGQAESTAERGRTSPSSPRALPLTHEVRWAALHRAPSGAQSPAPAPEPSFPEVHGSSGWGLGPGQSGSSALAGFRRILIILWECLILARFVHQLFPTSHAEGFAGSCA